MLNLSFDLTLSIGVGGSKSAVGKTAFIEKLIQSLKKKFRLCIIGVKYTKTSLYSSIVSEPSIIEHPGKDTERMKKAGADFVYWVRATENDLNEVIEQLYMRIFQQKLNGNQIQKFNAILIVEGNSLVRVMQPDVIIFLKGQHDDQIKPSGKVLLEMADIVIEGKYDMEEVMEEIEKTQKKKLIEKLLKERSNDGKITCSEARKIAEELNVSYIEVGRAANELKIKIRKCELGCF